MRVDNKLLVIPEFSNPIIVKSSIKDEEIYFSDKELLDVWKDDYSGGDLFLVDKNVFPLVNTKLEDTLILEATEENKTLSNSHNKVFEILDWLLSKQITKQNKLIVIGGGICQDISAYLTAVYKRGIDWIFIPTTVLAMGDSCMGGKCGINYRNENGVIKNLVALFTGPSKVIINTKFIQTLSRRDVNSGIAEIFKLAVIGGQVEEYRRLFKENNLTELIKLGLLVKKSIVEEDRFEKNIRKVLNYGHTFGHALESALDYKLPHGLAVAVGCYLIDKFFLSSEQHKEDILSLIGDELNLLKNLDYEKFFNALKADKKNLGNQICFIVCKEGEADFVYHPFDEHLEQKIIALIKNI